MKAANEKITTKENIYKGKHEAKNGRILYKSRSRSRKDHPNDLKSMQRNYRKDDDEPSTLLDRSCQRQIGVRFIGDGDVDSEILFTTEMV
jgi:hypothetical protein